MKAQDAESSPTIRVALIALLVGAFALRFGLYLTFPNVHHPDEVFQYSEQAHRLLFGYGVVPWEYVRGTRSWLFPGVIAGLIAAADAVGLSDPRAYLAVVAAALSALSLSVVAVGYLWARRLQGAVAGLITAAICAVWFELVYFAPKTLSETVAAHLMVIGVWLAYPAERTWDRRQLFAAGLLFGIVFVLRPHVAPALFVAAVYACRDSVLRQWLPLAAGAALVVALAGLLDAITWSFPFHSMIANVWINLVEGKSREFGVQPWTHYAGAMWRYWRWMIFPMAALCLAGMRRAPLAGLIAIAVIASHTLVAHKEYRFIFPALPFIVILLGIGTADAVAVGQRLLGTLETRRALAIAAIAGWAAVSGALAVRSPFRGYWGPDPYILAFRELRKAKDLCGVGLVNLRWWRTGGYVHLHRQVPVILLPNDGRKATDAFNYAIVGAYGEPVELPHAKQRCWSDGAVCLYRLEQGCAASPEQEINPTLRRREAPGADLFANGL